MIPLTLLAAAAAATATTVESPVPSEPLPAPAALADDEEPKKYDWEGGVTVGLKSTSGNTDSQNVAVTADAVYRREDDRFTLGLLYTLSRDSEIDEVTLEDDERTTERKAYAQAQYDYFFAEEWYALANASAETDLLAGLDHRYIVGAGIGHQILEDEEWNLKGEVGLSHISQEFDQPDPEDPPGDYVSARIAADAQWNPNERWQLGSLGQLYPSLEDSDVISSRLDSKARLTLSERLYAQLQWVWEWNNAPAAGKDRNDHTLLFTLGWTF